jgi:hypothetical protein
MARNRSSLSRNASADAMRSAADSLSLSLKGEIFGILGLAPVYGDYVKEVLGLTA